MEFHHKENRIHQARKSWRIFQRNSPPDHSALMELPAERILRKKVSSVLFEIVRLVC